MDALVSRVQLAEFYERQGLVVQNEDGGSLSVYRPLNGSTQDIITHRFADDGKLDLFIAVESLLMWDEALALDVANAFRSENRQPSSSK